MFKLSVFCAMLAALQLVSGWGEECFHKSPGLKLPDDTVDLIPGITSVEGCKKYCRGLKDCVEIQVVGGKKCYMKKMGVYVKWEKMLRNQPNVVHYQNCEEAPPGSK